eukprot:GHVS01001196.1.p1 GENE.GHVS01001196.1~~GHVS01001196.1.p1  ORF type:complete len:871 (+),score=96.40 GHVS01001196.1:109-2721(+)
MSIMGGRGRECGGSKMEWKRQKEDKRGSVVGKQSVRAAVVEKRAEEEWSACGGGKESNNFRRHYAGGGHKLRLMVTTVWPVLLLVSSSLLILGCTSNSLEDRLTTVDSSDIEITRAGSWWKPWTPTLTKPLAFLRRTDSLLSHGDLAAENVDSEYGVAQMEVTPTRRLNGDGLKCIYGSSDDANPSLCHGPNTALPDTISFTLNFPNDPDFKSSKSTCVAQVIQQAHLRPGSTTLLRTNAAEQLGEGPSKITKPVANMLLKKHVVRLSSSSPGDPLTDDQKSILLDFIGHANGRGNNAESMNSSLVFEDNETEFLNFFGEEMEKRHAEKKVEYEKVVVRADSWMPEAGCRLMSNVFLANLEDRGEDALPEELLKKDKNPLGHACVLQYKVEFEKTRKKPAKRVVLVWLDAENGALSSFDFTNVVDSFREVRVFMTGENPQKAALLVGYSIERDTVHAQQIRLRKTDESLFKAAVQLAMGIVSQLVGTAAYLLIEDPEVLAVVQRKIENTTTIKQNQQTLSQVQYGRNTWSTLPKLAVGNGVSLELRHHLYVEFGGEIPEEPDSPEVENSSSKEAAGFFRISRGSALLSLPKPVEGDNGRNLHKLPSCVAQIIYRTNIGSTWTIADDSDRAILLMMEIGRAADDVKNVSKDWRLRLIVKASAANAIINQREAEVQNNTSTVFESAHAVVQAVSTLTVSFHQIKDIKDEKLLGHIPNDFSNWSSNKVGTCQKIVGTKRRPSKLICWWVETELRGAVLVIESSNGRRQDVKTANLYMVGDLNDDQAFSAARLVAVASLPHGCRWCGKFARWNIEVLGANVDKPRAARFLLGLAQGLGIDGGNKRRDLKLAVHDAEVFSNIQEAFFDDIMNNVT